MRQFQKDSLLVVYYLFSFGYSMYFFIIDFANEN